MWPVVSVALFAAMALCFLDQLAQAKVKLPGNESIPAAFVFGDSVVDTGNNNYLNGTLARCNFPPYGRDFEGRIATGRFSNGKGPSDLFAEEFGIKELLPPYLDPTLETKDLISGVNFGSGGAGFDPLTSELLTAISLGRQLEMFKQFKSRLKGKGVGEGRANLITRAAIFIVAAGSNDLANLYTHTPFRSLQYNSSAYAEFLSTSAANFVMELYGLGGRKIAVLGVPPIGCLPSQMTVAGQVVDRKCVDNYNQVALLYNSRLRQQIELLKPRLSGAKIAYVDVYDAFLDIIKHHRIFGFDVVDRGCCGTGLIEAGFLCNQWSLFTCENDSGFLFWDSYHPTEKFYKIILPSVAQDLVDQLYW